jgi:hypothetical protein
MIPVVVSFGFNTQMARAPRGNQRDDRNVPVVVPAAGAPGAGQAQAPVAANGQPPAQVVARADNQPVEADIASEESAADPVMNRPVPRRILPPRQPRALINRYVAQHNARGRANPRLAAVVRGAMRRPVPAQVGGARRAGDAASVASSGSSVASSTVQSEAASEVIDANALPAFNPNEMDVEEWHCTLAVHACGFRDEAQRQVLHQYVFDKLTTLQNVKETDLRDLIKGLPKIRMPDGIQPVVATLDQMSKLIGLMHYVQDFTRMGMDLPDPRPYLNGPDGMSEFSPKSLELALERAKIRENLAQQSSSWSKANNPGNFTSGMKFRDWDEKFVNFLKGLPGVTGIPLNYVIRDELRNGNIMDNGNNYLQLLTAKAPLIGTVFDADSQIVHGYLRGFLIGQPAEHWNKELVNRMDGRQDMLALRAHYGGSGNTSTMLAEAQQMYDTLQYRSEKVKGNLEKFLTDCQKMFILFDDNGEPMTSAQKVKFVLDKKRMLAPGLQTAVELLRVQQQQRADSGNPMTFIEAANLLTRCMQDNIAPVTNARNQIAASSTAASRKNNNKKVNKRKGNTSVKKKIVSDVVVPGVGPIGFISRNEYRSMTREQRQRLRDERDKHGVAGGNKSRNVAAVATSATSIDAPTLERMLDAVSQRFIGIARISGQGENAGDAFGGRAQAARDRHGN